MRRLYTRIYLHFVGVLLIVGLASSLIFAHGWRGNFLRAWGLRIARHSVALISTERTPEKREAAARRLAEDLELDVTIRDNDGHLMLTTGPELPSLTAPDLDEINAGPAVLRHKNTEPSWFIAARLNNAGTPAGTIELLPMRRLAQARIWRPLLTVALVLLVIGIGTGPLARRISRPVEQVIEASRRFGDGDLTYRVKEHRRPQNDEIGQLTRAWNTMAERVERMVRGQRELLANVSHELRSPLTRIRVALELVPETQASQARLNDVRSDLSELERLIDDVLTTSRLEMSGLPTHRDDIAVAPLFAQILERAKHDPTTQGKAVTSDVQVDSIVADGALITRALWNLVENSGKYGAPPIRLSASQQGDLIRLTVEDHGAGIPEADRERVLEPFFRGDRARTPQVNQGFGLGLTLARRIAEVHGGKIQVESAVGGGCKITLEIPTSSPT